MKIETKYNYGDTIWCMYKNKPVNCTVIDFSVDCSYKGGSGNSWGGPTYPVIISYSFTMIDSRRETRHESQCFPSKEELLSSL